LLGFIRIALTWCARARSSDRIVDVSDLGILATNWQGNGNFSQADFNLDGHIDVTDLGHSRHQLAEELIRHRDGGSKFGNRKPQPGCAGSEHRPIASNIVAVFVG
jgi:hypothetical protein